MVASITTGKATTNIIPNELSGLSFVTGDSQSNCVLCLKLDNAEVRLDLTDVMVDFLIAALNVPVTAAGSSISRSATGAHSPRRRDRFARRISFGCSRGERGLPVE
jgi:hypothetical protein